MYVHTVNRKSRKAKSSIKIPRAQYSSKCTQFHSVRVYKSPTTSLVGQILPRGHKRVGQSAVTKFKEIQDFYWMVTGYMRSVSV